jgi:hypothetical protein
MNFGSEISYPHGEFSWLTKSLKENTTREYFNINPCCFHSHPLPFIVHNLFIETASVNKSN